MAPGSLRDSLLLLWYAGLARFVLRDLIGFLTKSNEGQTLCSLPPPPVTQFPPQGWRTAGYLGISIQKISVVRTMYEAYADCRWTFPVNSPHFHVGRQGGIRLERGTTLVCRVVIALAHYPSCRFRSSLQWGCLLATSS